MPKNATIFDSFEKQLGKFDIFQYPHNITSLDIKIPAVNITTFWNLKPTIIEVTVKIKFYNFQFNYWFL